MCGYHRSTLQGDSSTGYIYMRSLFMFRWELQVFFLQPYAYVSFRSLHCMQNQK